MSADVGSLFSITADGSIGCQYQRYYTEELKTDFVHLGVFFINVFLFDY